MAGGIPAAILVLGTPAVASAAGVSIFGGRAPPAVPHPQNQPPPAALPRHQTRYKDWKLEFKHLLYERRNNPHNTDKLHMGSELTSDRAITISVTFGTIHTITFAATSPAVTSAPQFSTGA
ncbi:hypothetical protein SESBI_31793 [Sesbania bispinosa]|nr:hypothetical protein SESBI_31793 [Sesbania bispinosa]